MQWIKTAFLILALCVSFNAAALTDDEEAVWRDAIAGGDVKTVEKFVDADAKVVNETIFGWSPLQMAVHAHQVEVVKYLIANGADLNYIHPTALHTAFHLAAMEGDTRLTTLLAKSGADVNIKLRHNISLIQYFRDHGNTKMMEHLASLGVKDDGCKSEYC